MVRRVRDALAIAEALAAGKPVAQVRRTLRMPSFAADRLIADVSNRDVESYRRALELGATESWAGELEAGAGHLTSAVVAARANALGLLVVAALSHLAAALLAQGKFHAARVVAQEALALGVDEPQAFREAHERARMVVELADLRTDPWAALSGAADQRASADALFRR